MRIIELWLNGTDKIRPIMDWSGVSSTDVVEDNDHSAWDVSTTYNATDRVVVGGTTHKIYESAAGSNLGNDPTTDDGTWWTEISYTNFWKPFDGRISDQCSNSNTITYSFAVTTQIDAVAIFKPEGSTVNCKVIDDAETTILDTTEDLGDNDYVFDWLSFWTQGDVNRYKQEVVFTDLPAYNGYTIEITITATGSTAKVGQICLGREYNIGESVPGTEVGIQDFSTVDFDSFGYPIFVQRDYAKRADFQVSYPTEGGSYISTLLASLRAFPAVFMVEDGKEMLGTTIYGVVTDFTLRKRIGRSTANIEITGMP